MSPDKLFDLAPGAGAAGAGGGADQPPAGAPAADRTPTADCAPLAARARPRLIGELVGQDALLSETSPLRGAIEGGRPHSMILCGPPGSGKTTLARIIGRSSGMAFEERSAVQVGLAEVRALIDRARVRASGTIFFLDEIHRFNRAQQDALLPAVEEGLLTLIGATTQNPAYEVNRALLSRLAVYRLQPLDDRALAVILRRALGLEEDALPAEDAAIEQIATLAAGDARSALGILELAIAAARTQHAQALRAAHVIAACQGKPIAFDRAGDSHYDYISAWIKATRGSDPDASLYYLAVMLEGGEDPRFIARRMLIFASEDIGNADPTALTLACATAEAVERLGMPEAHYALAQAAVHLALAPKSNAAGSALAAARGHVARNGAAAVPAYLQSGVRPGRVDPPAEAYEYPHDLPGALSGQRLLPDSLGSLRFFTPAESEPQLAARLASIERLRRLASGDDRAQGEADGQPAAPPEGPARRAATGTQPG